MATEAEIQAEKDAKVEFTEAQQAKVNQLITDAMGRAGKEAKVQATALETKVNTLTAELAEAKAASAKATTKEGKKEAQDDIEALKSSIEQLKGHIKTTSDEANTYKASAQAKDAEIAAARADAVNVRKQVAINSSAAKANFINTDVVAKLTQDDIKWDADRGKFVVNGPNGQLRLNAGLDPMSLDEYMNEFAVQNPYLVRGDVKPGIGSTGNRGITNNGKYEVAQIFGAKSDSRLAMALMKENPAEYHRLKDIARESGLVHKG